MQTASENIAAAICKRYREILSAGRDLLVSSHAGTRLPIAANTVQGAPPQPCSETAERRVFPVCISFLFLKEKSGPRGQSRKRRRHKDRDMLPTVALSTSGIRVKALPFLSLSAPLICVIWYASNYTSKIFNVNHCNYLKLVYSSDVKIDIGELTGQWAERGLTPSRPGYLIWIMPT